MMEKETLNKVTNLVIFFVLLGLSLFLLHPIFMEIITAIIIAIIFYPLYKLLANKLKIRWLASLIIVILVIFITVFPIFLIGQEIIRESVNLFSSFDEGFVLLDRLSERFPMLENFSSQVEYVGSFFISKISEWITSLAISIPSLLFDYFIMLIITFFLLIKGSDILNKIFSLRFLNRKQAEELKKEINKTTYGIIYGQIMLGLVQGFIGGFGIFLGSLIFNVPNTSPITLGILMAICSLIPIFGTGLVWIPISIISMIQGFLLSQPNVSWYGLYVLLYGALVVATVDDLLRPVFISSKTNINTLIVFLGVIGGIASVGIIGIFLGPLVLGLLIKFIAAFESKEDQQ